MMKWRMSDLKLLADAITLHRPQRHLCQLGPGVWDFGTTRQYPVLKHTPGGPERQR